MAVTISERTFPSGIVPGKFLSLPRPLLTTWFRSGRREGSEQSKREKGRGRREKGEKEEEEGDVGERRVRRMKRRKARQAGARGGGSLGRNKERGGGTNRERKIL
jgi:hypothetical protein